MTTQFKSLLQVLDFFKSEETCISYLANSRWGETPTCPHCGNVGAYATNRGYKCKAKECHKKFTVTTGTIFENTKISLRTWYAAMYLCTAHKKGISSLQLSRDLAITQKTAWFLLHRIREMLTNNQTDQQLKGTIEVDETYVGGKDKNKSNKKRTALAASGEKWHNKTTVFALLERDGEVRTQVIQKSKINFNDAITSIKSNADLDALILTDSSTMYGSLKYSYKHETVNHASKNT